MLALFAQLPHFLQEPQVPLPTPMYMPMPMPMPMSSVPTVPEMQAPSTGGGSTSQRNLSVFNYGNVKTTSGGYKAYPDKISGLMGVGERALRYNNAPERGWHAQTLRQFAEIYAPWSDGNNPAKYASDLGSMMGVNPNARINFRDPNILAGIIQNVPILEHGRKRVNISRDEALLAANRLLGVSTQARVANLLNSWGYKK